MAIKKTIDVSGMHCEKCVAKVKEALEAIDGVRAARVNLDKANAIVKMDAEIDDSVLVDAIEAAGFEASAGAGTFAR